MSHPALVVNQLRKTYNNGTEALKGINLVVQSGDFFALLGPNGSGKSTLIGIISSLVKPTAGDTHVFGVSLKQQRSQAKKLIGVVPQEINFSFFDKPFDICVYQAGFYGIKREIAIRRTEQYLKELRLWDKAFQPANQLSGGMKRRLMIARAMINEPKLLVLDEPTAGMDIEIRQSMWQFIRRINAAGTTVILTTHYLEEAEQLCQHIAIIDQGCIVRSSTSMKALLSSMKTETFVLDINQASPQLPHIPGITLRCVDTHRLEAEITREDNLHALFKALSAQNIMVTSMRNKTNRLESLFLRLTSKDSHTPMDTTTA